MKKTDPTYELLDEMTALLERYQPDEGDKRDFVPHWDEYFHAIAQVVALRSKDEGRKVGAVIVGREGTVLSTGFNGFARGIRETVARKRDDQKLFWVTHAEANAIFNAARSGTSLVGSTIYVTTYPCNGCAQAIVQAGIKRVFTYGSYWIKTEPDLPNRWEIAPDILAEAHVAVDAPHIRHRDVEHWEAARMASKRASPTRRKDAPRTNAQANKTARDRRSPKR